MDFRLGHNIDVGSHQASCFAWTDERRRSCNDSLSARYVQGLEEEPSEVLDDPLHGAEIIQQLHKRNKKDDNGKLTYRGENRCHRLLDSFHQQSNDIPR